MGSGCSGGGGGGGGLALRLGTVSPIFGFEVLSKCALYLCGCGADVVELLVVLVGEEERIGDHRVSKDAQQILLLVDPAGSGEVLDEESNVGLFCHL